MATSTPGVLMNAVKWVLKIRLGLNCFRQQCIPWEWSWKDLINVKLLILMSEKIRLYFYSIITKSGGAVWELLMYPWNFNYPKILDKLRRLGLVSEALQSLLIKIWYTWETNLQISKMKMLKLECFHTQMNYFQEAKFYN